MESTRSEIRPMDVASSLFSGAFHALETVSLDVLAGVVGSSLFLLSLVPGTRFDPWVFLCLCSAVLAVYNLDHLLDARETDPASTPRRRRYAEHQGVLAVVLAGSCIAGSISVGGLPAAAWKAGGIVAVYQVAYFAGLRLGMRGSAKRIMATVGWAAGIAIPAWCASPAPARTEIVVGAGLLSILGWINLQSYALVDARAEADPGQLPGSVLRATAIAVAGVGLTGAFLAYPSHAGRWTALACVALVQFFLTSLPSDFVHPVGEWSLALLGLFALAS
jgi:hypothetical protein